MAKQFLSIVLLLSYFQNYSQTKNEKLRSIGISIPVIWNNSEGTYYQLGSAKYPSGKAISYGININHSRTIYKNLFGIIGIGYFKQVFSIPRPFEFDDPTNLAFFTQSYKYANIQLLCGIGYQKRLNKNLLLKGILTYNYWNSFRQKYIVNKDYKKWQIKRKSMPIGRTINLNLGVEKNITQKISIGLDALLPISTNWNDDEIFIKNFYSENSQQIGRNKFSIGTNISCIYHF